ncbi:hypothetical protein CC78DRAFT_556335 [Lojkania enalia]|uniref:Fungal-type protein kinase domain-containing protein n=1 Tax=Lojkania enalia TaxID=147567 RepID=A0A9P4MYT8_9PLEO|nr:hypothetical protein CC78DRAFT_556335 [Didymosphaeria enalia]
MRLWEFDRLGGIASTRFDVNEDGLQFVSAVLGFLSLNEEQLGFDPTIITAGDKRYIEIERDNRIERLVIDKQYPEREGEGELLREATDKGVVNVARYYHYQTVRVGGQDNDIRINPESLIPPLSTTGHCILRKGRSSSAAGRERSSSCTDAPLPSSKRTCLSLLVKGERVTANRVHRRVIIRDYGKAIYKASSRTSLLAVLIKERVVQQFEKWNYIGTEELAKIKKGEVADERDFLKAVEENFTPYFQLLIPCVNRLRRKVFPNSRRWRDPNPKLYFKIKEIL